MASKHVVLVLVLFLSTAVLAYTPNHVYLDRYCGDLNQVFKNSLILGYSYNQQSIAFHCAASFQADQLDKKVQVRFRSLNTNFDDDCHRASLALSDSMGNLTALHGVCGNFTPVFLYRTRQFHDKVKFTFTTDNSRQSGSFEVLLTAFTDSVNGSCRDDFHCNNGICISNQLTCNGYNECGDNSDEVEGCSLTTGTIVGIVLGSLAGVFVILLIAVCTRRRRGYMRIVETVQPYPATKAQPPLYSSL